MIWRDFSAAIEIDSNAGDAFRMRGICKHAKGDLKGAIADYDEALRLDPKDMGALRARAHAYVQDAIPRVTYDLHQFCGAMGLTLEFKLHYWTYRLKALLGELGGSSPQARAAAMSTWKHAVQA